ncbi:hypothetical protein Ait01nite_089320 [Actinoplanes italicus]|uniref:Secreted protein n=1 Tax=Actinoplanes italicus TaxID=113567 RepID=A0A2T0JID8_9ACTN|nr:hypothetical protein [Actinoplanes italicus]PRX07348.1 hypothetical protein CLV67_14223 [Actinoplanes italicus]GIE35887.1 hypothetical protein Ait01nite_089320 [Actinoplanes italicus]
MKRRGWYWWAALLLSSLTTGTAAVAISLHSQAESERKFCEIVISQDDAWSESTPTTATGRRVAEAVAKLRRDLGCPAR